MKSIEYKSKSYLHLIGILYLLVIILAGFSQGYVRGTILSAGNATETAENILNNLSLFRLGLTTDLIAFILDAIISVMLYQLFRPFGKSLALIMASLRLLAHPAIASLNLLNHYLAYQLLSGDAYLAVFTPEQLNTMSLLFAEAHQYGYLIAGAFFGLHLLFLGILVYKTPVLPKWLGGFLLGSAAGYLLETFGNFTLPGNEAWLALVVGFSAAIGELSLTIYLLGWGGSKSYKEFLK
tara:strand:- start:1139 stop:1852 length:714 start_codon:yes stop_codon:yes gene_type:complete